MTQVRRLGAVGAALALAALFTCSQSWGGPGKDDALKKWRASGDEAPRKKAVPAIEDDLAESKFAKQKIVTYVTKDGQTLFAYQLAPKLDAREDSRGRDFLILVDTSASKARGPLMVATQLAEAVVKDLGADDTAALWTVNVEPKRLTKGFLPKKQLASALKALHQEYPSGAANLKKTLTQAIDLCARERDRRKIILFLGGGSSIAGPLTADDRAKLCGELVKNQVNVFTVPLGKNLDPLNLHGLATGTGGLPVRLKEGEGPKGFMQTFRAALAVPVLYVQSCKFSADVPEVFPTRLPPLRPDAPTLMVGRIQAGGNLACTLVGTVNGREVKVEAKEKLVPSEADNFFLAGIFRQWRERKDRPALLKADRSLASALEQNLLAREELIAQAEWALEKNELAAALQLYDRAQQLDPHSVDARAGKLIVGQLKDGKITKDQLAKLIAPKGDDVVVRIDKKVRRGKVSREKLLALAQRAPGDPLPGPAPRGGDDLLENVKRRQAVEDQRNADLVNDAIREATRLLRTNPDAAAELLKRTRDSIVDNPDVSERTRRGLAERLSNEIRGVAIQGAEIKRRLTDQAQAIAVARDKFGQEVARREADEQTRERMKSINQLIARARYEIIRSGDAVNRLVAIRASERLKEDLLRDGRAVPPALTAAYGIAQADFHLTELNELRRLREQRWLLTLLEVERRHLPFPDEPPIEFPPAARWKALTQSRKSKYETFRFGAGSSSRNLKLLLDILNTPQSDAFLKDVDDPALTLGQMLNAQSIKFSRPGDNPPFYLTFEVNQAAFAAEGQAEPLNIAIAEKKIAGARNISLASFLRRILERITVPSGATFVVRKEADLPVIITSYDERDLPPPAQYVVEITTGQFALRHKETIGYSVADLVVPIPNAVNSQAVQQQATLFGQFGLQGGVVGQLGAAGAQLGLGGLGIGGLGAGGLGLGALGAGGLGAGALGLGALGAGALGAGALGAGALGAGALGMGALGQVLGQGMVGVGGVQNFGVGGGQAGFGGGQLGQFGNLGGQFGLQGGTQQRILIQTIRQLIGTPNDWAPIIPGIVGPGGAMEPGMPPGDDPNANPQGNQLGYFPSALALVVKGTSLVHTRITRPAVGGGMAPGGGAMGALPGGNRGGDVVVIGGPRDPKRRVGGDNEGRDDKAPKVAAKPRRPVFKSEGDPKVVWQQALEKGVDDPGLIVATTDFLCQLGKFDHVAEFLKANLRQGIVVKPWVYETLAIALRESNASAEEIERAEISLADMEPQDADGFLKASKALGELKRYDRALALCHQAALLQPNVPQAYADALNYADMARDSDAMAWAAGNLLKKDWPRKNDELHARATHRLESLSKALEKGRAEEAGRLKTVAEAQRRRDLVIKLAWGGQADLDLRVEEPSKSVCSCVNRQSLGGGTLIGDSLGEKNAEMYVAAVAFPGKYKITVDTVWGRPLGDKAQLQVIQHQGTDKETSKLITVDLKEGSTFTIDLAEGRRTQTAVVPPPALQQSAEAPGQEGGRGDVFTQLRNLADPELVGVQRAFRASSGSLGSSDSREDIRLEKSRPKDVAGRRKVQNRVAPFVNEGASFTTQAVVSEDRRYVRLSVNATFNVVSGTRPQPVMVSVIPGIP